MGTNGCTVTGAAQVACHTAVLKLFRFTRRRGPNAAHISGPSGLARTREAGTPCHDDAPAPALPQDSPAALLSAPHRTRSHLLPGLPSNTPTSDFIKLYSFIQFVPRATRQCVLRAPPGGHVAAVHVLTEDISLRVFVDPYVLIEPHAASAAHPEAF